MDSTQKIGLHQRNKFIITPKGSELKFKEGLARGEVEQNNRNYGQAVKIYEKLLQKNKNNIFLLYNLAFCYYMKGKSDIALVYCDQVLQRGTSEFIENHNVQAMKSKCLISLGRLEEALELINGYLINNPNDTLLLLYKSEALLGLKKYSQSLLTGFTCIEKADLYNDEEVLGWALVWQGQAFRCLNICDQASQSFTQAMDIESSHILANIFYAEICYINDDYQQALLKLELSSLLMMDQTKIQNYTRLELRTWRNTVDKLIRAIAQLQEICSLAESCKFSFEPKFLLDKIKLSINKFLNDLYQTFLPGFSTTSTRDIYQASLNLKAYQIQLETTLEGLKNESIVYWDNNVFDNQINNDWDQIKGYTSGAYDYAKYFYWLLSNFVLGFRISTQKYLDEGQMKVTLFRIANEVSDYAINIFGQLPSLGEYIQDIIMVYDKVFGIYRSNILQSTINQLFLLDDEQNQQSTQQICEIILATSLKLGKYFHPYQKENHICKWHSHKKPNKIFAQVWQYFQEQVLSFEQSDSAINEGMFQCQASKAALRDLLLLISFLHKFDSEVITSNKKADLPMFLSEVIIKEFIYKPLGDVDIRHICEKTELQNPGLNIRDFSNMEYRDSSCCSIF